MKQKKLRVSETSKILADELRREMNKKQREDIVKKWEELGFLDGLSGHVKENITDLYCCKASSMLNDIKKDEK